VLRFARRKLQTPGNAEEHKRCTGVHAYGGLLTLNVQFLNSTGSPLLLFLLHDLSRPHTHVYDLRYSCHVQAAWVYDVQGGADQTRFSSVARGLPDPSLHVCAGCSEGLQVHASTCKEATLLLDRLVPAGVIDAAALGVGAFPSVPSYGS